METITQSCCYSCRHWNKNYRDINYLPYYTFCVEKEEQLLTGMYIHTVTYLSREYSAECANGWIYDILLLLQFKSNFQQTKISVKVKFLKIYLSIFSLFILSIISTICILGFGTLLHLNWESRLTRKEGDSGSKEKARNPGISIKWDSRAL